MTMGSRIGAALAALALTFAAPQAGWAGGAAPTRKAAVAETYLLFEPFQVSILENFRVRGLLTLEIYLDVADATLRAKASEHLPRLRDSFVRALSDYGSKSAHADRAPDIALIFGRLQEAADTVLGGPGARVLITQAYTRRSG